MGVAKISIEGNSLVGVYAVALDNVVLIGESVSPYTEKEIVTALGVPAVRLTIAGTSLIGVFISTDKKKVIVPHIIFDHEREVLEKNNIEYLVVNSTLTCLGNNMVCTKKGCIYNPAYEPDVIQRVAEFLDVDTRPYQFVDNPTVGSFVVHNGQRGLVSNELNEKEIHELELFLGLRLHPGTVNMGASQVSTGITANANGFIIGDASGGPEVVNADEAFKGEEDD